MKARTYKTWAVANGDSSLYFHPFTGFPIIYTKFGEARDRGRVLGVSGRPVRTTVVVTEGWPKEAPHGK